MAKAKSPIANQIAEEINKSFTTSSEAVPLNKAIKSADSKTESNTFLKI